MNKYKEDAEKWGNALNEVSWYFDELWREHFKIPMPFIVFNMSKTVLRAVILKYIELVDKSDSVSK